MAGASSRLNSRRSRRGVSSCGSITCSDQAPHTFVACATVPVRKGEGEAFASPSYRVVQATAVRRSRRLSAQMLGQETLHRLVELEAILLVVKAVCASLSLRM